MGLIRKTWPKKTNGGAIVESYPRGSVLCHIGDSRVMKTGAWGQAYPYDWQGADGIFEGWTSYNMGTNGTSLATWAASIAGGNQAEVAADAPSANLWATVNANPQAIYFSLLTNDFRLGAGAANLAAVTSTARINLSTVVNFLLVKTAGVILLGMPPPIAFASPDPNGYTDCVDANDAAARSAAMRTLYLEWLNVSDRVIVIDTHKHLFGYRMDTVAAPVDPEGQGALMGDTLHPTNLGATRIAQIISRMINPALPYTTAIVMASPAVLQTAIKSTLTRINNGGAGYIDFHYDTIQAIAGSTIRTNGRAPLNNLHRAEALLAAGAGSAFLNLLQCASFKLYFPDDGTIITIGGFTGGWNAGVGSIRLLLAGNYAAYASRKAVAYVDDATQLPRQAPINQSLVIGLNGPQPLTVGAEGASPLPIIGALPSFANIQASRDDSNAAATVDMWVSNNTDGGYYYGPDAFGYPGKRLGQLSFAQYYRQNPVFTADAANYPGGAGTIAFSTASNVQVRARVTAGNMGKFGNVTLRIY